METAGYNFVAKSFDAHEASDIRQHQTNGVGYDSTGGVARQQGNDSDGTHQRRWIHTWLRMIKL